MAPSPVWGLPMGVCDRGRPWTWACWGPGGGRDERDRDRERVGECPRLCMKLPVAGETDRRTDRQTSPAAMTNAFLLLTQLQSAEALGGKPGEAARDRPDSAQTLVASLSPAPGPPPAQRPDRVFLTPSGRRPSWEDGGTPRPSETSPWREDSCLRGTESRSLPSHGR